jgi:nucleotide-binding universal stress UspA family protein
MRTPDLAMSPTQKLLGAGKAEAFRAGKGISAAPGIDEEGRPAGVVSSTGLLNRMAQRAENSALVAGAPRRPAGGTILHPTDYSASSYRAFELACRLALDRKSRLIVMHVTGPASPFGISMAPVPPPREGYRGAWEHRLGLVRPADPNVRVEHRLEEGNVGTAILRVAREAQSELIVMGGSERTRLGRPLTGRIAAEVDRKAPCPVLRLNVPRAALVPGDSRGDSPRSKLPEYGTVLYPTDFSEASRRGFEVARSLARESSSELVVFHVAPLPALYAKRGYREEIEAALDRLARSDPSVRMRWMMTVGDPLGGILKLAHAGPCDLIVMGTRRRSRLMRLLTRSLASEVRRHGICPVATVGITPGIPLASPGGLNRTAAVPAWSGGLAGGHQDAGSRVRPRLQRVPGAPARSGAARQSGPGGA